MDAFFSWGGKISNSVMQDTTQFKHEGLKMCLHSATMVFINVIDFPLSSIQRRVAIDRRRFVIDNYKIVTANFSKMVQHKRCRSSIVKGCFFTNEFSYCWPNFIVSLYFMHITESLQLVNCIRKLLGFLHGVAGLLPCARLWHRFKLYIHVLNTSTL